MVKSHPVGDATATIMPYDREAVEPEPLHHAHHVLGQGSLGIWHMVWGGGRAAAASVAAKVGAHDREVMGKQRSNAVPHQVCLREAVQQEDRQPRAVESDEDGGLARVDLGGCEVFHHFGPSSQA
jgi:hypothetical protein